jgi:hypothetical protein
MPTIYRSSSSPKKTSSNFINGFKRPWLEIHRHGQVYQHGGEDVLHKNFPPSSCYQNQLSNWELIRYAINDWLNLGSCQSASLNGFMLGQQGYPYEIKG